MPQLFGDIVFTLGARNSFIHILFANTNGLCPIIEVLPSFNLFKLIAQISQVPIDVVDTVVSLVKRRKFFDCIVGNPDNGCLRNY